jgi:beta-N-acetylhexosaminidase
MGRKEKIGRLLIMGFKGTSLSQDSDIVKAIKARQIGGVILFANNVVNPQQLQSLVKQLREYADQALIAPFFIGIDYEGGTVSRLNEAAGFPKTLSAAKIGQLTQDEARKHAKTMASTLADAGVNLNFAPVLDVNVNPDNPIIGKRERSFSSSPQKVAEYAAIFADAYRQHGIYPVFKHFPGHGSSTGDTHVGFVDVTDTWQPSELEPYQHLLKSDHNQAMVMTSHVVHRGLDAKACPASLSLAMTKELLRDQLGFDGVVVTDDLQMGAITAHYSLADTLKLALNAGADLLIFGNQLVPVFQSPAQIIEIIERAIESGDVAESRIDDAGERIARLYPMLSVSD